MGFSSIWKKHSKCEAAPLAESSTMTRHIGLPQFGQVGVGFIGSLGSSEEATWICRSDM
jgi:hypothetical protein